MVDYRAKALENQKKNLTQWVDLVKEIFGDLPTNTVAITDKTRIIDILNKIGTSEAMNHTFFPSGGGMDLEGAKASNEPGLTETIYDGAPHVVNVESLTFHPISENPEWWYFRLNTSPFKDSGVYEAQDNEAENDYYGEQVVELEPGHYVDTAHWDMDHMGYDDAGNEIRLPKTARRIVRQIKGGAFVIFPKLSTYNRNTGTYDARHNQYSNEGFERYIKKILGIQ